MRSIRTFIGVIGIILGIGLFTYSVTPVGHERSEKVVSFNEKIRNAFEVAGLTNRFVYVAHVGLGGAGAGGMGAPEVHVDSAEQFAQLVPNDEQIYVTVGHKEYPNGYKDVRVVERRFWAFIEDRPGIVMYTETYSFNSWVAGSFTAKEALFFTETSLYPDRWYTNFYLFITIFVVSIILLSTTRIEEADPL